MRAATQEQPEHETVSPGFGRFASVRWVLIFITVLALALRAIHLGANSFWADEAASVAFARLRWPGFWHLVSTTEANMVLYYILLRGWVLVSDHGWFVRSLSVLTGVATVPVLYLVGEKAFSRRAGLYAAALLAVNSFHIGFSREARSYSMVVLLVCCSSLFFLRSMEEGQDKSGRWYVATSAAAVYAHFFAALVLLAQAFSLTFLPARAAWRQLRYMAAIAVLAVPLLIFVLFRNYGQLEWVQPATGKDVYHFFTYFTGSGLRFIVGVLLLAWAARTWISRGRLAGISQEAWSFLLIAMWLFLPILVTLAASYWKPLFVPRFLLICLPAWLLLTAYGLASVSWDWLRHLTLAVLLLSSLWGLRTFYRKPPQQDWKGATNLVMQNLQPDDVLLFPDAYCRIAFDYGLEDSATHRPQSEISYPDRGDALPQLPRQAFRVWVVSCDSTKKNGPDANLQLTNAGFEEVRLTSFKGVEVGEFARRNGK
jgi:mannosyltransferase